MRRGCVISSGSFRQPRRSTSRRRDRRSSASSSRRISWPPRQGRQARVPRGTRADATPSHRDPRRSDRADRRRTGELPPGVAQLPRACDGGGGGGAASTTPAGARDPGAAHARRHGGRDALVAWLDHVSARTAPRLGAPVVAELSSTTPEGTSNLVLVIATTVDHDGAVWSSVRLPVLPNNTRGWAEGRNSGQ